MKQKGKSVFAGLRTGRCLAVCGMILCLLWVMCLPVHGARETSTSAEQEIVDGFGAAVDTLPDEIGDRLPEGLHASSVEEQGEALAQMLTPRYVFSVVREHWKDAVSQGVRLLATVCGLLIIAAVLQTVRHSFSSAALNNTVRFCTIGALFAALVRLQYDQLSAVKLFFERLHTLMSSMIPIGGAVLAMGGNVTTAAAGSATLGVFLSVAEGLCARTVVPVCAIGTALALCQALCPEVGLRGIANVVRKTYTFFLGLVMSLLCFLLSSQSALCAAADSTGARTAKLVSALAIPTVGGGIGETLRTLAGSVQYLKSVVGLGGIFFIFLLLLPTFFSLLATRLVFLLGSGAAEMLGCESEGKLLSELGTVWGTMLAVMSMCAVMFVFALVIFVRVAVAAG